MMTKYETAERIIVNNRGISEEDFTDLSLEEHEGTDHWMPGRYYRDILKFTRMHSEILEATIYEAQKDKQLLANLKSKYILEQKLKNLIEGIDKQIDNEA